MSELPNGWGSAAIADVTASITQRVPNEAEQFVYIDIASIDRETKLISEPQSLLGKDAPSRARKEVKTGDVLVSMTRPNLNAVALVGHEFDGNIASTGFDVLRPIEIEPRWLFAHVRSKPFIDAMSELVQGALYPAVKSADVRSFEIPIPPLNEQKRIADKLDRLLARVDTAKARLDKIPLLLKRLRQAILAAATSGRLTEEWREEKNVDDDTWVRGSFMEFFDIQGGTQPPKATFVSEPMNGYVRLLQIRDFGEKPVPTYIPDKRGLKKCVESDVLLGRYGASVGKVCTGMAGAYNVALTKVVPQVAIEQQFVLLMVSSSGFYFAINNFQRSAQDGFNKDDLKQIEVALPSLDEQKEITRRVEELFAIADRIEAQYRAARARVDRLTQSLLAKAFKGELVPQDPSDEPAAALLERIRAQRAAAPTVMRGRRKTETLEELPMVAEPKRNYRKRKA
jgi:type I restriction enzyme S subunit